MPIDMAVAAAVFELTLLFRGAFKIFGYILQVHKDIEHLLNLAITTYWGPSRSDCSRVLEGPASASRAAQLV
jgi:hypothetical protein